MESIVHFMEELVTTYGYLAIFVLMLLESACIPFPSEVTMLVAGWYAADGRLTFFWAALAGVLGNLDRYGKYLLIKSHDIDKAEIWWERHGEAATFFSRLLPVIRTFISLPAGIAKMPFGKFTLYTFLGVIPWTFGLTWLGVVVGDNWESVLNYFDVPTLIIGVTLVVIAVVWYLRRRKLKQTTG
jgi:membrane protein DedA with SNARE-associated domain